MRSILFIALVFVSRLISAQGNKFAENIDFNGYIQIRGMSNFDDYTSFSVRRLKLWIKSKPEFSGHWSYKIQTTFSSLAQEKFFLQDVKIGYKTGLFSFDIGQFVPQYSLQRFQPDYKIAPIERARVVNALIPNGTLGVRDIGLQANFKTKNKLFETHFGIFNGYGIKEYRLHNKGFMLTHKSELNLFSRGSEFKIGYSLQYRKAKEGLHLSRILPDTILFSGNDFRYNLFVRFKRKWVELQAEFLNANLAGKKAYGYYFLSAFDFGKNQILLEFEKYKDLILETLDKPYIRIGYNYFLHGNRMKLSFDNYFQVDKKKIKNYFASVQLQLFLR